MVQTDEPSKISVGISSCLLGEHVRYDGGHRHDTYIVKTLGRHFEFTAFCPEVNIGLGVPREPIKLVNEDRKIRCVGTINAAQDHTEPLIQCADQQAHWHKYICGYIFKKGSPSCGIENVEVFRGDQITYDGTGIYAARLMEKFPHLPIADEARLGNTHQSNNFIQRVFIYHRWQTLLANELCWDALTTFHKQHEQILIGHNEQLARQLSLLLKQSYDSNLKLFQEVYIDKMTAILKIIPSGKNYIDPTLL